MSESTTEFRQVTFRLLPGSRRRAQKLAAVAGACRFVWNEMLDQQDQLYAAALLCGARPPAPTFFTLGKAFTQLRAVTPWLQEMPFAPVRYALKYQAEAWAAFFRGERGRPRFKRRGEDSVTIPDGIRIRDGQLHFPKIGPMTLRRRGGNPWGDAQPLRAVVKRICGRWYATVCYRIEAPARPDSGAVIGLDMNVRQVATSEGAIFAAPDTRRLEARKRRYQRRMARQRRGSRRRERTRRRLARTQRRIAMRRRNWQHNVSRRLAGGTVVLEDLNTRAMTASAKGTADEAGRNVAAKAGLNREILATGWTQLRAMLAYKAPGVIAVHPAYTSLTCHECGVADAASRRGRRFECVACGHADHADVNAARNIRRRGLALLHGEGRSGVPTPLTRETDRELAA